MQKKNGKIVNILSVQVMTCCASQFLVPLALPVSYILICIFSALHDSIHESGHGIVCRARGSKVKISLGSYECSPPYCEDDSGVWSVTAHPELFFRPIYRTSATCCSYPCQDPSTALPQEPLVFIGGLFGLFGMWFICISLGCFALFTVPKLLPQVLPCSRGIGILFTCHLIVFVPDMWILKVPWYPWTRWTMAFTCCFTQLDLLNEVFYAFTPAPNVLGEWRPNFDGVRQWLFWTSVPPGTQNPPATGASVRNGLWALLLLLYIVHTIRYLCLAARLLLSRSGSSEMEDAMTASLYMDGPTDSALEDHDNSPQGADSRINSAYGSEANLFPHDQLPESHRNERVRDMEEGLPRSPANDQAHPLL